jgi:hypothetical protein
MDESMSSEKMLARKDGAIAHMVFNNPERHNSMEMWEAAETILSDFNADDDIRVIVLSGAGGKAFVSGADISKFGDERASAEAVKLYGETTARAYSNLYNSPKPTIARLLHRRWPRPRGLLRYAFLHRRLAIRPARGKAGARLLAFEYQAARGRRRYRGCEGHLPERAALRCRGGPGDWTRKRGIARRRARGSRGRIRSEGGRQRAPYHRRHETDFRGTRKGSRRSRSGCLYLEGRQAFMEKREPQFKGR